MKCHLSIKLSHNKEIPAKILCPLPRNGRLSSPIITHSSLGGGGRGDLISFSDSHGLLAAKAPGAQMFSEEAQHRLHAMDQRCRQPRC